MTVSVEYAITITLKPKLYDHDAVNQYDLTYIEVYKKCKSMCNKLTLVAETTKAYNIHYHGIITFTLKPNVNLMRMFTDAFRRDKLFGYVNIKPIDNDEKWKEYIRKTLKEFRVDLNRPPVLCDDFVAIPIEWLDITGMLQYDIADEQ